MIHKMAYPVNVASSLLSKRGDFILNFPVSTSRPYKREAQESQYNSTTNPNGVINLGNAESHCGTDLITKWMQENERFMWDEEMAFSGEEHGSDRIRSSFAHFFNRYFRPRDLVTADHVIVGHGGDGIMESVAFALADAGDYFLCPAPYYYNIDENFGLRAGVKLYPVNTHGRGQEKPFKLTVKQIEDAYDAAIRLGHVVRGLLLVNPQNPLGTIIDSDLLMAVLHFCHKHKLHLLLDEVYSQIVYKGDNAFISGLALPVPDPERVHIIYSISKDLGLSGMRVGALVSRNQSLLDTFRFGRQAVYSSVPDAIARPVAELLTDDDWLENIYYPNLLARTRTNHKLVTECLDTLQIPYIDGNAAFFLWADFGAYIRPCTFQNETIFIQRLVSEARVFFVPGELFHCAEPGWFRVLITHTTEITKLGLERLKKFLARNDLYEKFIDETPFSDFSDILVTDMTSQASGDVAGLENLMRSLSSQLRDSDWLVENTADRWQQENPELAAEFRRLSAETMKDEQ